VEKGKRIEITLLADNIALLLRKYIHKYNPNYWLIESPNRKQYSASRHTSYLEAISKKSQVFKKEFILIC
jgi:hypothetical protein